MPLDEFELADIKKNRRMQRKTRKMIEYSFITKGEYWAKSVLLW